ncbi:MAG: hypothetical protein AB7G05_14935 [Hyphomonadaceae bacterium]
MKPAFSLQIPIAEILAFLGEVRLWFLQALACLGCERMLRADLNNAATSVKQLMFLRMVAAGEFRVQARRRHILHQPHVYGGVRSRLRLVLGPAFRGLHHGDARTRIERLQHILDHADALIAALLARFRRYAGRVCPFRLLTGFARRLGALCAAPRAHVCAADTS